MIPDSPIYEMKSNKKDTISNTIIITEPKPIQMNHIGITNMNLPAP